MKFKDRTFKDTAVILDDNEFRNVTFDNCDIHYGGARDVSIRGAFKGCRFVFDGAAGNTLTFLALMYKGGYKDMVEQTFEWIRTGQINHTLQ